MNNDNTTTNERETERDVTIQHSTNEEEQVEEHQPGIKGASDSRLFVANPVQNEAAAGVQRAAGG